MNFNIHRIVDYWRQHTTARIVRQYSLANIIDSPRKETNETCVRLAFGVFVDDVHLSRNRVCKIYVTMNPDELSSARNALLEVAERLRQRQLMYYSYLKNVNIDDHLPATRCLS